MAENVTFRPNRPKAELKRAFGNIRRKINELLDEALTRANPVPEWSDVLKSERPTITNEEWERCLRPE
ncbi:MAG: hypothetical protein AB9869_17530 [Verrucomicrobiia bacterium]